MSKELSVKMVEMMVTPESELEDVTIDESFGETAPELYQSSMWIDRDEAVYDPLYPAPARH